VLPPEPPQPANPYAKTTAQNGSNFTVKVRIIS
jgi:hypothetical protein